MNRDDRTVGTVGTVPPIRGDEGRVHATTDVTVARAEGDTA
ncbi:hypothetical protein [Microtetraspora glauca]|uniref:Uncharacterized protein n=1 Tax=Microtetraspora glauca TaxID=1996 RepID=A0ABV3GHI3_MICGL